MILAIYLILAALLLGAAFVTFRILVRRDYRRKGQLTTLTSFLELLVWLLFVFFPYLYNPLDWQLLWLADVPAGAPFRIVGLGLATAGIAVAVVAMTGLGMVKSFGQGREGLRQTGLYRFSRNPQIVGGGLMVLGIVVLWPSWYALGWLALYTAIGHMMVLTEEEHLRNVYGEAYARYCGQCPRYLGLARQGQD